MLFNSHIFILLFLPVTVAGYHACNRYLSHFWGKVLLAASSLIFVGYANILSLGIVLISASVNYILSHIIVSSSLKKKFVLIMSILFNVCILIYFKYSNFLIYSVNQVFGSNISLLNRMLPIGISFYSFQQIAYLVDCFKGSAKPGCFLDYFLCVGFFPKVIQGPIVQHSQLEPQFQSNGKHSFNFDQVSKGIYIFAIGLFKKILVADQFGKIVDYCYGHIGSLNSFEAILAILAYTFQLYFDFSGYCDMAIGIAAMLHIDLPHNFNSPYKALSISDFWKRWHITLTQFLTKYIYFPLGGNRKGIARTYFNILIVYLISGIWHGSGFTFILWGILHGAAMILYRLFQKPYNKLPIFVKWFLTFTFINITWVFFRAGSIDEAFAMLRQVFMGGWEFTINAELTETLLQPTFTSAASRILSLPVVAVIGNISVLFSVLYLKNTNEKYTTFRPSITTWLLTYVLLVISILSVSGVSTFLYTNF